MAAVYPRGILSARRTCVVIADAIGSRAWLVVMTEIAGWWWSGGGLLVGW